MAILQLHHLVAVHPRGAKLRARRPRRLKPIRPSRATELWYRGELIKIARKLADQGRQIAEAIRPSWPIVQDAGPRFLGGKLHDHKESWGGKFAAEAEKLADGVVKRGRRDVDDRLTKEIKRSVGIDVRAAFAVGGPISHTMDAATKANVALIRSMPEQYFEKLETLISSGWADGMRWESMAKEIAHLGDVTETRAKVIARDQTAKINSALSRTRQQSVGIAKYEWSTSQDERVRESHAELDGKTFAWDDPPTVDGEQVNPGEAILCRCVAIPVVDLDQVEAQAEALQEAA